MFFADAIALLAGGVFQAVREQWWASGQVLGGGILIGFWLAVDALIGLGLLRRSKTAFVGALVLAGLRILPVPAVPAGRLTIYLVGVAFAIVVIVFLVLDRRWFWVQRAAN